MIHLIPPGEETLHTQAEDCDCNPQFELDDETGEMVWIHLPLTIDFDKFVQI